MQIMGNWMHTWLCFFLNFEVGILSKGAFFFSCNLSWYIYRRIKLKKAFMYYDPKKIADILHENVFMQMYEFFFKNDFTPLISVPNIRCLSSILLASYCHTVEIIFWRRIILYSRLLLKESLGNGICFQIIIKKQTAPYPTGHNG